MLLSLFPPNFVLSITFFAHAAYPRVAEKSRYYTSSTLKKRGEKEERSIGPLHEPRKASARSYRAHYPQAEEVRDYARVYFTAGQSGGKGEKNKVTKT